jgi:hypothetical protein
LGGTGSDIELMLEPPPGKPDEYAFKRVFGMMNPGELLILILLTVSMCSPVKTESVDPALSFPYFPDPLDAGGKAIPVQAGGNVQVPLWYWIKITEYVIEVEKAREMYEAWRSVYVEEK